MKNININTPATKPFSQLADQCQERLPTAVKHFVAKKIHSFRVNRKGTSADDVYVPNLWYYELISCTDDSEIPGRGKSNIDSHEETDNGNIN